MSRLNDLALKYGTDKIGHGYIPLYEKHLPEKVNKFIELGVWKGAGIRMFKDYYDGEGMFYALDRFIDGYGLITISELQALGINSYVGSQDEMWFLETIKDQFTVLSEDCSHHWDSQISTFKIMFVHNIEPGGWYVCEDIFDEPYWGRNIIHDPKDNLMGALKKWQQDKNIVTQAISQSESDLICPLIDEVHLYQNIVFVKKRNA